MLKRLCIIGLGLTEQELPPRNAERLRSGGTLFLQTAQCAGASWLEQWGVAFRSMDQLYEDAADFDTFLEAVVDSLWQCGEEEVLYAVPGTPEGLPILSAFSAKCQSEGVELDVYPALGYADAALATAAQHIVLSGTAMRCFANAVPERINVDMPLCVQEIDNPFLAGDLKLALTQRYDEEQEIYFAVWERDCYKLSDATPLYTIDRQPETFYDASLCLIIPAVDSTTMTQPYDTEDLLAIVRRLRAPDGCPWDKEQTHQSLRSGLLEEAYEVADAIDTSDDAALEEELGDLLLQIAFHAVLAQEQGAFSYRDVSSAIAQKMILRHPHVFADAHVTTSDEVLLRWEEIKKKEKGQSTATETLEAVPRAFPALQRAQKLQKRAAAVGFDWPSAEQALVKVAEEEREWRSEWLQENGEPGKQSAVAEEMGDWFFSLVNVARLSGLDAEECLSRANDKFLRRFSAVETLMHSQGKQMEESSLEEMDSYWDIVKREQSRTHR